MTLTPPRWIADSSLQLAADVVLRRKWIALTALAVALSLGVPVALWLPNLYRATATLLVERQEVPASLVRPAVTELETRLATIHEDILSRKRLAELIDRVDPYAALPDGLPLDDAIDRMRHDIHVELAGGEQMGGRPVTIGVRISYVGADPVTVAQVANAIASLYVEENINIRERQAGGTAEFLEGELAAVKRDLDQQQARLNAFTTRYADQLPQQVGANLSALERLNAQLRLNADDVAKITERRDHLIEQLAELEIGNTDGMVDPELGRLKQRLGELQARFTDKYPEIGQVKTQIAALEQRLAAERGEGHSASERPRLIPPPRERLQKEILEAEAEVANLKEDVERLRSTIASYDERIQAAPRREQELEEVSRDYASTRELYQSLLTRYEEAKLADSLEQAKKGETFRILDPAFPPTQPAAPNRFRLLALVVLLGLAAAVAAVLLAEQLDASVRSVDELRQLGNVPVLATIPYIRSPRDTARRVTWATVVTLAILVGCGVLAAGSKFVAEENTQLVRLLARGQLSGRTAR